MMPQADTEATDTGIVVVAPDDLCSIGETCRLLKVSRRTVYNWMAGNKVRWVETPSGQRRLFRADLIRKQGSAAAAEAGV